jgi:hypothetical protein
VPFCAARDLDPWVYDVIQGANCLAQEQRRAAQNARALGKPVQHAVFKHVRAGIGAIWLFAHHDKPPFAEDTMVKGTAVGLRREAPLLARYDDTWDPNIVFGYIYAMAVRGVFIVDMPHGRQRPWVILLVRLRTAARSADVCHNKFGRGGIYAIYGPAARDVRVGIRGNSDDGTITDVRFFKNKTVAGRASLFGKWHSLGGYLSGTAAHPLLRAICPRRAIESYWENVRALPRNGDELFVSTKAAKDGRFRCIGRDTAAHDVSKLLRLVGVPERFHPHSTRHARISQATREPGASLDDISRHVDVSKKVIDLFYQRPCDKVAVDEQLSTALALIDAADVTAGMTATAVTAETMPGTAPPPHALAIEDNAIDMDGDADDDEYSVAAITGHRFRRIRNKNYFEFKIRWLGFSAAHDTWEPEENLDGSEELMAAYTARFADNGKFFAAAEAPSPQR